MSHFVIRSLVTSLMKIALVVTINLSPHNSLLLMVSFHGFQRHLYTTNVYFGRACLLETVTDFLIEFGMKPCTVKSQELMHATNSKNCFLSKGHCT